ncbi:MAG: hypothetical protein WAT19_02795 [Ferruginibacter sp.]
MSRIRPDVDIVLQVLEAVQKAKPGSQFIGSLLQQYRDRGGLSKKQLEGLLGHASKLSGIQPARLATLEAIIKKKHSRHRSEVTAKATVIEKDPLIVQTIEQILQKYPEHKRVLFFKMKYEKESFLNQAESDELKKFSKMLLK